MDKTKLTPPKIYRQLCTKNEGEYLKFSKENLKKMAEEMYEDHDHPAWTLL
jgi:hypothetical protein